MDKSINKRLNELGVSDQKIVEEKRVETHVNKMTSLESLRALKERYVDRRDELFQSVLYNSGNIKDLNTRIETVGHCIDLISKNKERNDMLEGFKFLLNLVYGSGWDKEIPKGLVPMGYTTLSYEGDLKIKNKIDEIKERWGKEDE